MKVIGKRAQEKHDRLTTAFLVVLAACSMVLSGCAGLATSNATQTPPVAPTLTTQPASTTVSLGQTATFSVVANGTAPLTYQWQKNGASINGATAASYTTPATTTADNGSTYQVVVSNSAGTATSNAAALTVNAAAAAPTSTTQPVTHTETAVQTASYEITANST